MTDGPPDNGVPNRIGGIKATSTASRDESRSEKLALGQAMPPLASKATVVPAIDTGPRR